MGAMTNGFMSLAQTGMSMYGAAQAADAENDQGKMQADLLRQQAEYEKAQAETNAAMMRRQREMEKAQERRSYEQELSRARVGGISAESLLASADRFSLSSSQKDWLTGQQSQNILDAAAQRATSLRSQAAAYGARAKAAKGANMLSMLQGGLQMAGTAYGMYQDYKKSGQTEPTAPTGGGTPKPMPKPQPEPQDTGWFGR
ncbi:MAG: hypothetical protein AB1916_15365 [Thermodesulfobacteriota bacterium]